MCGSLLPLCLPLARDQVYFPLAMIVELVTTHLEVVIRTGTSVVIDIINQFRNLLFQQLQQHTHPELCASSAFSSPSSSS